MAGKRLPTPTGAGTAFSNFYYLFREPIGSVFYVNSNGGTDDSDFGYHPLAPLASINYAIQQAVADNDDHILVAMGHTETVTGAAGLALNKAGVHLRGVGRGNKRPKIDFTTATGASFDITAAGCSVEGFYLKNAIDSQTAMVNISAADTHLADLDFEHADSSTQAALCILTTTGADRMKVRNCRFRGSADAGTSAAISMVGGNDIEITDNVFEGSYSDTGGVIKNATTDSLRLLILRNSINNRTASNTKSIVLTATSTGRIAGNWMQILSGTAPITGAAMSWAGANYYAAAIATAGTLI